MNLKVLKGKQALQLAFLLGVCFWLLYQIEHSHGKGKGYGGSIQGKLNYKQRGVNVLGRKWDSGWSSDDMNLVGEGKRKEDGGVGDDELDGNVDEEFGKEPEHRYMVFLNNEENNSDDSWGNLKKQVKKGLEREIKEPEKNKEMISDDTLKQDQDVEVVGSLNRENEEDRNIVESKEEIAEQPVGAANNVAVVGRSEMLDGVIHGFHDENGVPQDANNPLESTLTDHHSRDDRGNFLNQETSFNSSNNYSRFSETFSRDEAETKE
ncbi:hypothetical protein FH972_003196 [Carpinus fangiana]|uniref:Uncharacterized protein n=1 Tax=Carpinus fangiana TaxID=176857 RepID=A0A5N6QHP9_9ROSI|nr:hypothetical protein FH972_003196 [Carpinus fangiana]